MNFIDIVKKRRSIRKFDRKEVPKEVLEQVLYHGSLAPSGKNRQPWRFVVVKNEKIRANIADIMISGANETENAGKARV